MRTDVVTTVMPDDTALLGALTVDLSHKRLVLMTTSDLEDPARLLYAWSGWQVIGPGLSPEQVIMGKLHGAV